MIDKVNTNNLDAAQTKLSEAWNLISCSGLIEEVAQKEPVLLERLNKLTNSIGIAQGVLSVFVDDYK